MTGEKNDQNSCPDDVVHTVLPVAVARAVDGYTDFSSRLPPDNAKEFTGFHTACRAAINHIAALLKLGKLCTVPDKNPHGPGHDDLETLLRETRETLLKMDLDAPSHDH